MPKHTFKKFAIDKETLHKIPFFEKVPETLHSVLFSINRKSVSKAFLFGLFFAFVPMPMQMSAVLITSILFRHNLPISIILVWITNPVTIPLFFGFEYWLGTIILGRPFGTIDFTNIGSTGQEMLQTLYVGGLTVSSIAGLLGYFGIQIFWKYQIFKKIKRRKK